VKKTINITNKNTRLYQSQIMLSEDSSPVNDAICDRKLQM